jgi:hypothetical protein
MLILSSKKFIFARRTESHFFSLFEFFLLNRSGSHKLILPFWAFDKNRIKFDTKIDCQIDLWLNSKNIE